jgi:tRNA G46 methylase TrmB
VALVAVTPVGPVGSVVAMDHNPNVLKTALARAQAAGLDNVSCVAGDCRDTVPASRTA